MTEQGRRGGRHSPGLTQRHGVHRSDLLGSDPGGRRRRPSAGRRRVVWRSGVVLVSAVVALVGEVLLFAALGQLVYGYGHGGWVGILAAGAALLVAAGTWALFMAPKAVRRVGTLVRILVSSISGVLLGALLAGAGWPRFGAVVVAAGLAVAATDWADERV